VKLNCPVKWQLYLKIFVSMLFGLLWKSGKIFSFVLMKLAKSQISSIINWHVVYWKTIAFKSGLFIIPANFCLYISGEQHFVNY